MAYGTVIVSKAEAASWHGGLTDYGRLYNSEITGDCVTNKVEKLYNI